MEISVHDNFVLSYHVDAQQKEIRLQTAYFDGDNDERTEVIFREVAAYHFECDNFSNVVFDIEETELSDIYKANLALFERLKNYGWPCLYNDAAGLLEQMRHEGVKGFVIHASSGLCGWVWARAMEIVAA